MPLISMFKLETSPNGQGLRCDRSGLFFAGEALLKRDNEGKFRPRADVEIKRILSSSKTSKSELESLVRSVHVVAAALCKGEVAKAMIAAVLMRLTDAHQVDRAEIHGGKITKAGFDPDELRDYRGRWATISSSQGSSSRATREAFLEPLI